MVTSLSATPATLTDAPNAPMLLGYVPVELDKKEDGSGQVSTPPDSDDHKPDIEKLLYNGID